MPISLRRAPPGLPLGLLPQPGPHIPPRSAQPVLEEDLIGPKESEVCMVQSAMALEGEVRHPKYQ